MTDTSARWTDAVQEARQQIGAAADLARFTIKRFFADDCPNWTGALAYTTLLSLVPLAAIGFAMLTAFPVFNEIRERLQDFIFENFVPGAIDTVEDYLRSFLANTDKLTAVGIVFLAVTAVLLLSAIEATIGTIFRESRKRSLVQRILIYWALLTLGPLLVGASVSLSSYLFFATAWFGTEDSNRLFGITPLLPPLIMAFGLTVLYKITPNMPVRWRDAVGGAVVGALLFELLKKIFGLYVANAPVQTVYGALSAIPLFLFWLYLGWAAVLLGAELAAGLPEWRAGRRDSERTPLTSTRRLSVAISVLGALHQRARNGERLAAETLAEELPATGSEIGEVVAELARANFIAETADSQFVLARDLDHTTLYDLYRALGMGLAAEEIDGEDPPQRVLSEIVTAGEDAIREIMADDLKSLLAGRSGGEQGRSRLRRTG